MWHLRQYMQSLILKKSNFMNTIKNDVLLDNFSIQYQNQYSVKSEITQMNSTGNFQIAMFVGHTCMGLWKLYLTEVVVLFSVKPIQNVENQNSLECNRLTVNDVSA